VLRVRRQVKKLRGGQVFALPKNDRERVVPLSDWAAAIIKAHAKAYRPDSYTLPWEKLDGKLRTHNLLFRWSDDKALRANTFNDFAWKPALVKATVIPEPPAEKRKGRIQYATDREHGMHALRHYYGSVLLADGIVHQGARRVPRARRPGVSRSGSRRTCSPAHTTEPSRRSTGAWEPPSSRNSRSPDRTGTEQGYQPRMIKAADLRKRSD
jgi:integrase